jgi:hypothetical protein
MSVTARFSQRQLFEYIINIAMPTSVHIPDKLLKQADKRAKALGISRNRLIVRALERELETGTEWSADFFDRLRSVNSGIARAVDEMTSHIRLSRRSKPPIRF